METPILSKKEQKLSMSGKKKKETLKNLLANPYKHYWPTLSDDDTLIIHNVLEDKLMRVVEKKVIVPWKDIKDVPRIERKQFRKKHLEVVLNNDEGIKKEVVFAINQVARGLERKNLSCLLIADDVYPQMLVRHITDLAVLQQTPTLVVRNLRNILLTKLGVSSTVLAIKKSVFNDRTVEIAKVIKQISKNYPTPDDHVNFNRSGMLNEVQHDNIENNHLMKSQINRTEKIQMELCSTHLIPNIVKSNTENCKFHLHRISKNYREFVPTFSNLETVKQDGIPTNENGFLTFGQQEEHSLTKLKQFKSLKVNRTRSNTKRVTKKAENLKRKR